MKTNYLALIACPVANMVLGMAWYGAFALPWMAGHGLSMEQLQTAEGPGMNYAVSIAGSLLSAFVLNQLFQRMKVSGWMDGLKSGSAIGFFGLSGTIVMNMFSQHPFSVSLIDGGYAFVLFCVYGIILGGWQKKE